MILSINTDNNTIVFDRFFKNPIQKLVFQRHNAGVLKVAFTDMQVAIGSRMVQFAIKPWKSYSFDNFLVYANSYDLDGGYFDMSPVFNVVAIQQLFPLSSIESVMLSMQLRWSDDSGISWAYSNVIDAEVYNGLFAGGELSSFQISSFLSQIVPILESYTWPINLFNTELSLNNSNLVMSGSASGIVMSGGSNYINLSAPNSWVKVNGNIQTNTLSATTINVANQNVDNQITSNLSATNLSATILHVQTEHVKTLVADTITVQSIFALSSIVQVLNVTQYELSGFNVHGNITVTGTLSGETLIASAATLSTLNASNIATNILTLTSLNAGNINSSTLSSVSLSANILRGNFITCNNIVSNTMTVGLLSGNVNANNLSASVGNFNTVNMLSSFAITQSSNYFIGLSTYSNYIQCNGNNIRILSSFVPSSNADPAGTVGMITWGDGVLYLKSNIGWRKANLGNI